jgi:hypothetical protein
MVHGFLRSLFGPVPRVHVGFQNRSPRKRGRRHVPIWLQVSVGCTSSQNSPTKSHVQVRSKFVEEQRHSQNFKPFSLEVDSYSVKSPELSVDTCSQDDISRQSSKAARTWVAKKMFLVKAQQFVNNELSLEATRRKCMCPIIHANNTPSPSHQDSEKQDTR